MDLLERYVYAVTRRLPVGQRADVADELRGTIEDMAIDHAKGKEPKAADFKAALIKLGDPSILAHRYGSAKRYLIGPRWYDVYLKTLISVVSTVTPIVAVIVFLVNIGENNEGVAAAIVDAIVSAVQVAGGIFLWMTIIFAFLERTGVDPSEAATGSKNGEWKPEQLPDVPIGRSIPRHEAVAGMAMNGGAIVLLACSSLIFRSHEGDGSMPILNPDLWNLWIPLFIGLSVIGLALDAWKYVRGSWSPALAGSVIAWSVAWIAGFIAVTTTQDIVNPAFIDMLVTNVGNESERVVSWTIGISTIVIIGSYVWNIIDVLRRYNKQQAT